MTSMFKARHSILYSLLFVSIVCGSFAALGNNLKKTGPGNPQIAESDDPREVLKKTLSATQGVKSYRLRIEAPSFTKAVTIMEYAFPDSARMLEENRELIRVGKNTYRKKGDGPWEKYPEKNNYVPSQLSANALENHIKSLTERKDIKFIGRETVDGIPTLAYQRRHPGTEPSTEKAWIGVADGLLRRWEIEPAFSNSTKMTLIYTYYDYNADIKIEPPTKYVSVPFPARERAGPPSDGPGSGGGIGSGSGKSSGYAKTVDSIPILLNSPRPIHTEEARKNKIQGDVLARVLVGADGSVKNVRIIRTLPDGLGEEAIRTAFQMRFRPAMKDGQPVAFWRTVRIEFRLR
jgi:TonB family protein